MRVSLDLHGKTYEEAERHLISLIEDCRNDESHSTIEVITGNSERMKSLVKGISDEYGYPCTNLISTRIVINI